MVPIFLISAIAMPVNSTGWSGVLNVTSAINSMAQASANAKEYYVNKVRLSDVDLCDHYVGIWYGLPHSGFLSALDHWKSTPPSYRLSGWQPGALAFWDGGNGHVAIGDEKQGNVYSTDFPTSLYVGHASIDAISKGFNKKFLGWTKPYYH